MTLPEIIKLFQDLESGVEGQEIGFHIHQPIGYVLDLRYGLNQEKRFSDFLKNLEDHEPV